MTKLTLEQQKALDKVLNFPSCRRGEVLAERSRTLAVLEYYSKSVAESDSAAVHDFAAFRIYEALRTGDLDPIALEIIGETK